jgi:hypothetical protein
MKRWYAKTSAAAAGVLILSGFCYSLPAPFGRRSVVAGCAEGLARETFTAAKLNEYRAAGMPVLIDFTSSLVSQGHAGRSSAPAFRDNATHQARSGLT